MDKKPIDELIILCFNTICRGLYTPPHVPLETPGMSWCDKGQIGIFIPGGVWRSPLETSIFWQSPRNLSGLFLLRKSTGLWQNPVE